MKKIWGQNSDLRVYVSFKYTYEWNTTVDNNRLYTQWNSAITLKSAYMICSYSTEVKTVLMQTEHWLICSLWRALGLTTINSFTPFLKGCEPCVQVLAQVSKWNGPLLVLLDQGGRKMRTNEENGRRLNRVHKQDLVSPLCAHGRGSWSRGVL